MALQFILGGSGAGKTRFLYENIIKQSLEHKNSQFILLVPEQFTMQTQKEIVGLHPCHGTMNIDIVSFERLAYRVFEELAVENLSVLDDIGKSMILRKVAAGEKKDMEVFKSHLEQAGFISQVKSMISELYQYGISREMLEEACKKAGSPLLRGKLRELSAIYGGFQEYIEEKFITAEEILDVLCRLIPRSGKMRDSYVALDGYTGFTPVQYRLLEQMMICCRQVQVTAAVEKEAEPFIEGGIQNLFYMSKHMLACLKEIADRNHIPIEKEVFLEDRPYPRFKEGEKRPALDFLEQNLYRFSRKKYIGVPLEIQLWKALNPGEEVKFIVREIKKAVKENGLRYRDIAVITGDLESYGKEAVRQFEENQIPYFLDNKKNITDHPLVELISSALEALRRDFSYESVFRYLKCGLATDNLEMRDRLENYALALGVRGFKRWNSLWDQVYKGGENLNLEELNQYKDQVIAPLSGLRQGMKGAEGNVKARTEAVVAFLEEIKAEEKLLQFAEYLKDQGQHSLAGEYSQVYGLVMELFDRVAALLGEEKIGLKEYMEILDAGFQEIKVGLIPATVDRVSVGDITRTRLDHIKILFFAGINDGIVPARKENKSILSDEERTLLKRHHIELAPTVREESFYQRYYLYLMMTKPSSRLVLSYAGMGQDGKGLRPGSLIGELKGLFPDLRTRDIGEEKEIVTIEEGKEQMIRQLQDYREGRAEGSDLFQWFYKQDKYKEEAKRLAEAVFYSYKEKGIGKAAARELYGKILNGSVTRLEQYEACAYAHFLTYGLELRERKQYELAPVDIGNLFHKSIDSCFRKLQEERKKLPDLTDEERKKLVKDCVLQTAEEYGNTILKSTARNTYIASQVERITDKTMWALAKQLEKGDFIPVGFEVAFSSLDNLKAMKIPLSKEEALHLRGRIDRLDVCEDQENVYVKIIDYKSGTTAFDLGALYYGLQLQLVVYMDAAVEMEERKNPYKKVIPAGIFYYHIKDPVADGTAVTEPEDVEAEILRQLKMTGLVNSELEVISHLDREIEKASDVIPVAMKDGIIQEARSSVASRKRFQSLRYFAREKLQSAGREILDGNTAIKPYKQGNRSACDYCPYHSVCGFDQRLGGYEFKKFRSIKPEEIWKEIEKKEGEDGGKLD